MKFGESTARSVRAKYEELLKKQTKDQTSKITLQKRGRPLMLGCLDEKAQSFLHVLRRKGGVVSAVVAVATARALVARSEYKHLKCLDLDSSFWAKIIFHRMGFKKRTCTTSEPEIPDLAKKEAKLIFQRQIAEVVEHHSIPFHYHW